MRSVSTGFSAKIVENYLFMLKIVNTISQLNIPLFLAIYAEGTGCDSRKEDALLSYLQEDFFRQKNAFYALWEVDGKYRSAVRLEPYKDGLLLQALETPPEERRKGYAYALLSQVLEYACTEGYTGIYSHIAKKNKASLSLHRKCGFQQISDSARLIDGTVTQNSCTMYLDL